MFTALRILVWPIILTACVTSQNGRPMAQERIPLPAITYDMKLEEALQHAVDLGGQTARDVRKLITKRKEWPQAEKILYQTIEDGITKFENGTLTNAVLLYISGPVAPKEALFKDMISSGRPLARQLAWQMAGALPSKVMRGAMSREISRAVYEGDEDELFIPAMAVAVQSNRLTSAYSVVRRGLMSTNKEEFAQAMTVLNPVEASNDFLNYLALCPPEELRQLAFSSVSLMAVTVALNHMLKYQPDANHPQLEVLYYYAISRNTGVSETATLLVENLAQKNNAAMALTLARLPAWVQVAFIEGARRNMTASKKILLWELKKVTAQNEVVEELGDIKL